MNIQPVSLVIPTYNRADLISETIESALGQTTKFSEIVVVDDGSTDNTAEILEKYKGKISVERTSNSGVQHARNRGVELAHNELVVLCDSDDLLRKNYLEVTASWMAKHTDQDILYANFQTFDSNGEHADKLSQCPFDFLDEADLEKCISYNIPNLLIKSIRFQALFSSGVMFRKSFYQKLKGYNPEFNRVGAEDWDFTLRAITTGNVAVSRLPLTLIRRHPGNDSKNNTHMKMGEALILEKLLEQTRPPPAIAAEICQSINERKRSAFSSAFSDGNFALLHSLYRQMTSFRAPTANERMKYVISRLPAPIGKKIWQLSQRI
ncbi:MAG: glycosyltransferase [Stagnimonas sp.]|nr:glycosyltransferase [Stagnimonas sp.]